MGPGREGLLLNTKAPLLHISLGRGLDQTHHSILTQRVEMAISIGKGTLPNTTVTPGNFSSVKTHCSQHTAVKTIQVIANQNRTAVVIAHVLREVDFLRLAVLYLNQSRAGSIVRRN